MSGYVIEFGPDFGEVAADLAQISDDPVEFIQHVLSSGCLQIRALERNKPKVALETCRKIAETVMTMLRNDVTANLDKPPDVFHYTLYKAVRGIVDTVNTALS